MNTVVLAAQDIVGDVLAQQGPELEPPPDSARFLQLTRYLIWLTILLVPVVIGGVVALILVLRPRVRRSRPRNQRPTTLPPQRRAAGPPPVPDSELPGADGWDPPDPSVWGRPGQH
ncbi:hypothetical protein OG225_14590 [Nocardia sp. NBC_01377]|uniref:hypothetical protein n=1 Tax=Nocardia sp. NBC_01377 TaxID=2903595 RepID=UPI0032497A35